MLQTVHRNNDITILNVQTLTTKANDINYDEKEMLEELKALFDEKFLDIVVLTFAKGESYGYEVLDSI